MQDLSTILSNTELKEEVYQKGTFTMVKLQLPVNGNAYQGIGFSKCRLLPQHVAQKLQKYKEELHRIREDKASEFKDNDEFFGVLARLRWLEDYISRAKAKGDVYDRDLGIEIARRRAAKSLLKQMNNLHIQLPCEHQISNEPHDWKELVDPVDRILQQKGPYIIWDW